MSGAIIIDDVTMTFPGGRSVLVHVDFEVAVGESIALLGRNGAGKTSLLRLMSGGSLPTTGRVFVSGFDTRSARAAVAASTGVSMYAERSFYYRLTLDQNLRYFQSLRSVFGRRAARERDKLFALVALGDMRSRLFMELSLGQRKRLGLARALLAEPDVVLLDEPFANLDAEAKGVVANVIAHRGERGLTTVFSTHELADVRQSVDRVATLEGGGLTAVMLGDGGTRPAAAGEALRAEVFRQVVLVGARKGGCDLSELQTRYRASVQGGELSLSVPVSVSVSEVVRQAEAAGMAVEAVTDEPWLART